MDDLITLRTSDDPPIELKAARSVLVAGSKVFSDMLSLPQSTTTSKDGAIDVAETESELSPFLRLLNLSHDEGDPLEDLKSTTGPSSRASPTSTTPRRSRSMFWPKSGALTP
ncbi:hypothetical protein JCM9279_002955 [Rhodotorula babjevae]